MNPTAEQIQAVELVRTGGSVAVEALAGAGKTSTLALIAADRPDTLFAYVAFNKAIVTDAQGRFGDNVTASTAHSLAFRAVGRNYSPRLKSGRMSSLEIARATKVVEIKVRTAQGDKVLPRGFLGGLVLRAVKRFCQSDRPQIGTRDLPALPGLDLPGEYVVRDQVAEALLPALRLYWNDVERRDGVLPFDHGCYLKLWQLRDPKINADAILFDEAQDASDVMLDVVRQQTERGAQVVFVGDRHQQIYEWAGAVNAMEKVPVEHRSYLTQSFRFGQPIADAANRILDRLDAPARVVGDPTKTSTVHWAVGEGRTPNVWLTRTNGEAITLAINYLADGKRPAIVGGADDVIRFAKAAEELRTTGRTAHPELACFDSWEAVKQYVEEDPNGDDLKALTKLVEGHGTDGLVRILGRCAKREDEADVVLSTAHKSKGRQWEHVALAGDFPDPEKRDPSPEELRLVYVAATRAQKSLDVSRAAGLFAQA